MQVSIYPYTVRVGGKDRLLCWMTDEKDRVKVCSDGCLFVARDKRDATRRLGADVERDRWNEPAFSHIDDFWVRANALRANRKSSVPECKTLLEGWNFFEDVLSTLSRHELLDESKAPRLKKIYEKLFYGNNLKPVTPEGKSYHPEWTAKEITAFRETMRSIWDAVRKEIALPGA